MVQKKSAVMDNVAVLQKAGIVHKAHTMTANDVKLLNTLDKNEVAALISMKKKLGNRFLGKVSKGDKFPHPESASF